MDKAKLFMNGQSQAVRLPKAYRFAGDEVYIKREGEAVILLPKNHSWDELFDSLTNFTDDFMHEREQPPLEDREEFSE